MIRLALANLPFATTRDESVERVVVAIREASEARAAIICFPESYLPGYRIGERVSTPPDQAFLDAAWSHVRDAAARHSIGVVLGTERLIDDRPRITTLVIDKTGDVLGFQDKVQLDPSEEACFDAGTERQVFTIDALTFGVSICHEGWRYPESVRWAAQRGAKLVFHPHFHEAEPGSYRPTVFAETRNSFFEKAVLCRAAENTIYLATVNYASEGSPTTSAVIRPDATVQAYQDYGKAGLLVTDIDLSLATGLYASRLQRTP